MLFFFFNDTATTEIYTLSLHDALPISGGGLYLVPAQADGGLERLGDVPGQLAEHRRLLHVGMEVLGEHQVRSEEHTSELQSRLHLVCRLLLEKKKLPRASSIT